MRRSLMAALAVAAGTLALAGPALGFELRDFQVSLTDPGTAANPTSGAPQLAAGAHPDVTVNVKFPVTEPDENGQQEPTESVKDVDTDFPRGMIFDPTVAPQCSSGGLSLDFFARCPIASQVGIAYVGLYGDFEQAFPVYNVTPPPGVPAQFGFNVAKTVIRLNGKVRTGGDYGLSAEVRGISQALPLFGTRIELWGAPADPVHDAQRQGFNATGNPTTPGDPPVSAGIAPKAFISNPGRCTGEPLRFTADAASWESPAASAPRTTTASPDGAPLTITGCEAVPFEPTVSVQPTTTAPDSPTGLDVTVGLPQSDDPTTRATAHLKDLSILLPEGMNVNPSAADGLAACSPAQIALDSAAPAACPDASSLGSVTIDTPLLDEPLRGRAYLAAQGDNPFGTTLAMYVTARGSGVVIKLPGRIDADPATGRLRVTFADNPELPFTTLKVSLDAGDRAPLTTPAACGPQTVQIAATPWSGGATKTLTDGFSIDCAAGLGGFAPGFSAGTTSPTAGLFSPLSLSVVRPDGQAALQNVSFSLPPGLLARISGVPLCGEVQAAAGSCDPQSKVGSGIVTAGAGRRPFPVGAEVFLTGPYQGAPYGLVTRVRVVAGPLDLGTVVVRQALFIDPETTQVSAVSDPLPTILAGIPIRLRQLDINLDRPDFTVNPTSCAAGAIGATLGAVGGASVPASARFQVGGCGALPLTPKLRLQLSGRGRTLRDGGHPGVAARLTMPAGQSGLRRVEVKLPLSLALDPDNAQALCESDAAAGKAPQCPAGSVIGRASVRSPLLPEPLSGPVYFVKGVRTTASGRTVRTLPKLVLPLKGNGLQINVRANTAVRAGRLVTQFDKIPDAPISRFDLRLDGGGNGVLVATKSVCKATRKTGVRYRGHTNRLTKGTIRVKPRCG